MHFGFENQLKAIMSRYKIGIRDICLVGSSSLNLLKIGNRRNNDVDFILKTDVREKLITKNNLMIRSDGSIIFSDKVEAHLNRFNFLGLDDDKIFSNNFSLEHKDYTVLKPEILLCFKIKRRSKEDMIDLEAIQTHAFHSKKWSWDLVFSFRSKMLLTENPHNFVSRKPNPIARTKAFVRHNIRFLRKSNWNIIDLLYAFYLRFREKYSYPQPISEFGFQTIHKIHTGALLGYQFRDDNFFRYDIILRYLTVKSIVEGKEDYKLLYSAMQNKRAGTNTYIGLHNLVKSFQKKGFIDGYPISVTEQGLLWDGSHRLANALYWGIDEVPITITHHRRQTKDYGLSWFSNKGFPRNLISHLDQTKNEIFERNGVWFPLLLWPPIQDWFNDISYKLKRKYKVVKEEDLFLQKSFNTFLQKIYDIDNIEQWKIQMKILEMQKYDPKVRLILIEFPNPNFRQKGVPQTVVSKKGEALKQWIRNEYCKKIPGYFYDVICHTGDNQIQNQKIIEIVNEFRAPDNKLNKGHW